MTFSCGLQAVDQREAGKIQDQEAPLYVNYAMHGAAHALARDLLAFATLGQQAASDRPPPVTQPPHVHAGPGPCPRRQGHSINGGSPHPGQLSLTPPSGAGGGEPAERAGFAKGVAENKKPRSWIHQRSSLNIRNLSGPSGNAPALHGSLAPHDFVAAMPTNRIRLVAATAEAREVRNQHFFFAQTADIQEVVQLFSLVKLIQIILALTVPVDSNYPS